MALLFIDGFDMYNGIGANTGIQAKWAATGGAPQTMVTGRFGGQAVRYAHPAVATGIDRAIPAGTSFAFGCAIRIQTVPAGSPTQKGHFAFWKNGLYSQCCIQIDTGGAISAYRQTGDTGGTLLGSSAAGLLTINVWYYLEVEVVISTTVGRITAYLNGVQVLNLTGQNTANGGVGTNADLFRLASINGGQAPTLDVDDLYVTNVATKLGERRVETLRPSADSSPLMWTPDTGTVHYSRVNATLAQSVTYVQGSAINDEDLYDLVNLSSSPGTVDCVQYSLFAQKTDANTRAIAVIGDVSAVTQQSGNFNLATGVLKYEYLSETKPGGGAWSAADVNNLKVGPKVTF